MLTKNANRHFCQMLVSICQIYGDYLYFFTVLYKGERHHVEDKNGFYFWAYFIGMNAVWIVVPAYMIYDSYGAMKKAFSALDSKKKK